MRLLDDLPKMTTTIEAALCARSFRHFVAEAWPIVEPARAFVPGWHIDAIADHLAAVWPGRTIRNLLVTIPPRHTKSTLVSVLWPVWVWCRAPGTRFLTASYAEALSMRDAVRSRRVLRSTWFQERWPLDLADDQDEKRRYQNLATGYRIATSVGGSTTGEGGDVLIVDDPHHADDAYSPTALAEVRRWWQDTMANRVNDPKESARVVIMQRIHEDDLAGHFLGEGPGAWTHLSLPAIAEPVHVRNAPTPLGWVDDRAEGDLLWPTRFGPEEIATIKRETTTAGFSAQQQQRPVPLTGVIFDPAWWRVYDDLPGGAPDDALCSWDLAFDDTDAGSYVVGQAWQRFGGDVYLVEQVRERADFSATLDLVEGLAARWPVCRPIVVEKRANGPALLSLLQHAVAGLEPFEPRGSKAQRAWAAQPIAKSGNVYLPRAAPWRAEFIDELRRFPRAGYDDQVDAYSQAMAELQRRQYERAPKSQGAMIGHVPRPPRPQAAAFRAVLRPR